MTSTQSRMDPALEELIAEGAAEDHVAIIVRLHEGAEPPPGLHLVARFGTIATGRADRGALRAIHDHPSVASLKAPRTYAGELGGGLAEGPDEPGLSEADPTPTDEDRRRPEGLPETGRGVVVAVIDWGCDFAHPDFRASDGRTRLIGLWDQRASGSSPRPYGYGRLHGPAAIDRALAGRDPFAALGYAPSIGDAPTHGSHVLGIAAGNGRAGGPQGIAPEADLFFCHLGPGLGELGDSIGLMEAVDCAVRVAGRRPVAINLSIGRHAGPHDGSLLIERAIDWLITNRPGTVVVQSTGNYYARDVHMAGRLHETQTDTVPFRLEKRDDTAITVEVWYKAADTFHARVVAPDGQMAAAPRGENAVLRGPDGDFGTLYHRAFDPNNGDHLIQLVLRPVAPSGDWRLELTGIDVVDGRWHAWIERNPRCPPCQVRFPDDRAEPSGSTGSICNALRTIAVGAYDGHSDRPRLARFSSVGPTRDGRPKPLLVAPGVRVLSVRSRGDAAAEPGYVRMSGTSMAAPHVTGTAALMLQAAGAHPIAILRAALFATLAPPPEADPRWGYGRLDISAAVARARRIGTAASGEGGATEEEGIMAEAEDASAPVQRTAWTVGRDFTQPTVQQRVLGAMSEAELEAVLGEGPPLVAAVTREAAPEGYPETVAADDPLQVLDRAIDPEDPSLAVVAWPGLRPAGPLMPGDLVVQGLGAARPTCRIVLDPRLRPRSAVAPGESAADLALGYPGYYVRVAETTGEGALRRIMGPDGLVLPGTLVLRSGEAGDAPDGRPTLRRGASGPAVREAQVRLNRLDAARRLLGEAPLLDAPLAIDGRYGARTEAAARAFQRVAFPDAPDQWDGVLGRRSWAALLDATRGGGHDDLPGTTLPPEVEVAARPAARTIPIIALPGVMGTRLRLAGGRLPDWDPDSRLTMLRWFRASATDKLAGLDARNTARRIDDTSDVVAHSRGWDHLSSGFYRPLLAALERTFNPGRSGRAGVRSPVYAFGYDWRQSCGNHARALERFIDSVLERERAEEVVLVTHSMGGLVVRGALPLIAARVRGVVHCVMPAAGAVVAARRMRTGFDPAIDGNLGEMVAEMAAEALGLDPVERDDADEGIGDFITTRLFAAIFSDSLLRPNPLYYGRLMARLPGAVELLPSNALGRRWWGHLAHPRAPASVYDAYAAPAPAGLVHAGLSTAEKSALRARFADAGRFHAGLGYHPRTGVLASSGLTTDVALEPNAIRREGDGTVPLASASCPGLTRPLFARVFSRVEHSECFSDPGFLDGVLDGVAYALGSGAPLGSAAPPRRSRAGATAP
ncbi:S8 family serine peptidase [Tropicimonas sp. IMCC34043]|uniref:S8 family serine peptidase n=1 Tax=Tropicimonas sp. IMCC34043 TaxID=2248760 RepID=UPI000E2391C3|nr:S8 family serine peptidase [Tropicimonas sp. IMCC34043]